VLQTSVFDHQTFNMSAYKQLLYMQ